MTFSQTPKGLCDLTKGNQSHPKLCVESLTGVHTVDEQLTEGKRNKREIIFLNTTLNVYSTPKLSRFLCNDKSSHVSFLIVLVSFCVERNHSKRQQSNIRCVIPLLCNQFLFPIKLGKHTQHTKRSRLRTLTDNDHERF